MKGRKLTLTCFLAFSKNSAVVSYFWSSIIGRLILRSMSGVMCVVGSCVNAE